MYYWLKNKTLQDKDKVGNNEQANVKLRTFLTICIGKHDEKSIGKTKVYLIIIFQYFPNKFLVDRSWH